MHGQDAGMKRLVVLVALGLTVFNAPSRVALWQAADGR
jgi:hypothetical protein